MFEAIGSFWNDAKKLDTELGFGASKAPVAVALAFVSNTVSNKVKQVFGFDSDSYIENPEHVFQRECEASWNEDHSGFRPDSKFGSFTADEFMRYQDRVLALSKLFDGKSKMRKADLLVAAVSHPEIVAEIQAFLRDDSSIDTDTESDKVTVVADTVDETIDEVVDDTVDDTSDDTVDEIVDEIVDDDSNDASDDVVVLVAEFTEDVPRSGIDISGILDSFEETTDDTVDSILDDLSENDIDDDYADALYASLEDDGVDSVDDSDAVLDTVETVNGSDLQENNGVFTLDVPLVDSDDEATSSVDDIFVVAEEYTAPDVANHHVSVFADIDESDTDFELDEQPMSTYSDKRYADGLLSAEDLAEIDSSGSIVSVKHDYDNVFVEVFKSYVNYFLRDSLHFKIINGSLVDAHTFQRFIIHASDTDTYTVTDDFYKYLLSFVSWHYLCSGMLDRGVKRKMIELGYVER